jgi:hypothetical protein
MQTLRTEAAIARVAPISALDMRVDITAAGELLAFGQVLSAASAAAGIAGKHALVDHSLSLDMRALGQAYLDTVQPRIGKTTFFIDKLPLNYFYVGLIRAALPQARLIFVDRDPMDTIWAVYKAFFVGAYPFAYDLDELARYYLAWRTLMDHWLDQFGDAILRVRYEDIVADTQTVARRLVAHCGLPWQPECAAPEANHAPVATASAVQVRHPIHARSVGRWERHAEDLAPVLARMNNGLLF